MALFDHDQLIGIVLSMRVDYAKFSTHTYDDLIGQKIIKDNPKAMRFMVWTR